MPDTPYVQRPLFDTVLFIRDGEENELDTAQFPFLCNMEGHAKLAKDAVGYTEIHLNPERPELELGASYIGISWREKRIPPLDEAAADNATPYWIKEFDFKVPEVRYEPMWATSHTAQAFGMTLLQNRQCIRFGYRDLRAAQYTYGKWAGHQSPYIGAARDRELLTHNPTDLEYHDFPHVFFADATQPPLVISVARWRPFVNEIALADLWIKPGDALILPPKRFPDPPSDNAPAADARLKIVDLHGNRNSALACWFQDGLQQLVTETILATDAVMSAEATRPHYHEEKTATRHEPPPR
ncbi:hypothetical protein IGB42_00996 [Andreprevotia sp. IGB-42]|uniref:hypothetical protein n=1 Tax=Andreprevotia sp. IGB-42 TaxID=2497473 RepID=UPI0013568A86|nr:hypothetical protein [Andreprevotia sp. IGB-42]KAF0814099.1 hypothetical protein IGB42_00996 [Andreprevotia sp. IGB-42]